MKHLRRRLSACRLGSQAETRLATRRHPESGFALLFVFLLAAFIAIALYVEIPRVIFEGQRTKEDMLIERGEQYRRGIQLYFRKFRRYPPDMEALENTNSIRFLRRRYKDPMTGEDEWRVIHAGPGGVLLDSLVQKPPGEGEKKEEGSQNTFITEGPAVGATLEDESGDLPAALRLRRPSEGGAPLPAPAGTELGGPPPPEQQQTAMAGQPGPEAEEVTADAPDFEEELQVQPGGQQGLPGQEQPPFDPNQPAQQPSFFPGQTLIQPGQTPLQPGQQPFVPGQQQPGQPVMFPPAFPGSPGANPGSSRPGQPYPFPGRQLPPQPVPNQPVPYSQPLPQPGGLFPGNPGQSQPGPMPFIGAPQGTGSVQPGGATQGQDPLAMIQNLLTRPNPRGLAAIQQQQAAAVGGPQIGGGIAGVASKLKAEAIKVYNERSKYHEWEFVYDFRKDASGARLGLGMGTQGVPGQAGGPLLGPGGQGTFQPGGSFFPGGQFPPGGQRPPGGTFPPRPQPIGPGRR
jgi:hypothetical protein